MFWFQTCHVLHICACFGFRAVAFLEMLFILSVFWFQRGGFPGDVIYIICVLVSERWLSWRCYLYYLCFGFRAVAFLEMLFILSMFWFQSGGFPGDVIYIICVLVSERWLSWRCYLYYLCFGFRAVAFLEMLFILSVFWFQSSGFPGDVIYIICVLVLVAFLEMLFILSVFWFQSGGFPGDVIYIICVLVSERWLSWRCYLYYLCFGFRVVAFLEMLFILSVFWFQSGGFPGDVIYIICVLVSERWLSWRCYLYHLCFGFRAVAFLEMLFILSMFWFQSGGFPGDVIYIIHVLVSERWLSWRCYLYYLCFGFRAVAFLEMLFILSVFWFQSGGFPGDVIYIICVLVSERWLSWRCYLYYPCFGFRAVAFLEMLFILSVFWFQSGGFPGDVIYIICVLVSERWLSWRCYLYYLCFGCGGFPGDVIYIICVLVSERWLSWRCYLYYLCFGFRAVAFLEMLFILSVFWFWWLSWRCYLYYLCFGFRAVAFLEMLFILSVFWVQSGGFPGDVIYIICVLVSERWLSWRCYLYHLCFGFRAVAFLEMLFISSVFWFQSAGFPGDVIYIIHVLVSERWLSWRCYLYYPCFGFRAVAFLEMLFILSVFWFQSASFPGNVIYIIHVLVSERWLSWRCYLYYLCFGFRVVAFLEMLFISSVFWFQSGGFPGDVIYIICVLVSERWLSWRCYLYYPCFGFRAVAFLEMLFILSMFWFQSGGFPGDVIYNICVLVSERWLSWRCYLYYLCFGFRVVAFLEMLFILSVFWFQSASFPGNVIYIIHVLVSERWLSWRCYLYYLCFGFRVVAFLEMLFILSVFWLQSGGFSGDVIYIICVLVSERWLSWRHWRCRRRRRRCGRRSVACRWRLSSFTSLSGVLQLWVTCLNLSSCEIPTNWQRRPPKLW